MAELTDIQLQIAKQINAKELKFAKFMLVAGKDNDITVQKGKKAMTIKYNEGLDLYDVEYVTSDRNFNIKRRKVTMIYFDQLRELIEDFFKFKYVMHNFVRE